MEKLNIWTYFFTQNIPDDSSYYILYITISFQVVRNSLADITRLRERPKDGDLPDPTDEKKPPRKDLPQLSYGANKKYPHLSKAIEVTI